MACQWLPLLPKCVSLISGPARSLVEAAYVRISSGLRPRTSQAYMDKFSLFLAFTSYCQIPIQELDSILAFMEFLVRNGSRAQALNSYVSVLRHYFRLLDVPYAPLSHRKVHLFIKSVAMNAPYTPKFKANFSVPILLNLVKACDSFPSGFIYKSIFLLAYFAFLRLSNLAPSSSRKFDPTRNFTRGDIIFGPPGAHVIVKWAKSMQSSSKHQVVQIPSLPSSPLCPVSAFKVLLASTPGPSSSPLFVSPPSFSPISAPMVSATLSRILTSLNLDPSHYGFHAFRRSAVSWAADHDVPLQNLKAHGGWSSNAIHAYLKFTPKASSTVATTFQQHLPT